jgi:uncharacterized damage-inducible protein DinB
VQYLKAMYEYNFKFAEETLRALRTVPEKKFLTEKISGWGSLRDTTLHLISTEDYWLNKVIKGKSFEKYRLEDYPDIDSLERKWREIMEEFRGFVNTLTPATLRQIRTVVWDKEYTLVMETILQHVYTHTVHHRGQIVAGIRLTGGQPPYVDVF